MTIDRGAVSGDWTDIDECHYLGSDVISIYAILGETKKLWKSAITNGITAPGDNLVGIYLGDNDEVKKYRIIVNSGTNTLTIDVNTGNDASPTWSNVASFSASGMDHGTLAGLSDDDHTQYSRVDGTRAFTGTVAGVTPTTAAHLATKAYVDLINPKPIISSDTSKLTVTSGSNVITLSPDGMPLTSNVILRDGSQAFTGSQSHGNYPITNVGTITAVSGTFSQSLTVSGVPVITNVDLFTAVASGTEVVYFVNATSVTAQHSLNSTDIVAQVYDNTSTLIQPNVQRPLSPSSFYLEFASPQTGRAILLAATQRVLGAGNLAYIHTQSSSSATWTIEHALGSETPVVMIYNNSGQVIQPDTITATDGDTTTIVFSSSQAGTAVILKVGTAVSLTGGVGGGGGVTDHGDLTGLSDDDHIQYLRADGTRALAGNMSFGGFTISNVGPLTSTSLTATELTGTECNLTTITGTTVRVGGQVSGQNAVFPASVVSNVGTFSNALTVSGIPAMHQGVNRITVSGTGSAQGGVNFVGSRAGNVSLSGNTITFDAPPAGTSVGGGSGISNVVEDTTPQLGGHLDVNGFDIDGTVIDIDAASIMTLDAGSTMTLDAGSTITLDAGSTITLDGSSESATIGGSTDRVSNQNVAKVVACFSSAGGSVTTHTAHNFNTSSVSRTSAGKYRITFTRAFADANYGFTGSAKPTSGGNVVVVIEDIAASGRQTSTIDVAVLQNGVIQDSDKICVVCFGDLS